MSRKPFVAPLALGGGHTRPLLTSLILQTAVGSCAAWRWSRVIRPDFPSFSQRTLSFPLVRFHISVTCPNFRFQSRQGPPRWFVPPRPPAFLRVSVPRSCALKPHHIPLFMDVCGYPHSCACPKTSSNPRKLTQCRHLCSMPSRSTFVICLPSLDFSSSTA